MNIEDLRDFCIAKKGVTEHFPFDEDTLVFKVGGKMFLLTSLQKWETGSAAINVKCKPEQALQLRQEYSAIIPGYHMNKKHWNTVNLDGSLSDNFIKEMIDNSYHIIVKSLPSKTQQELEKL